MKRVLLPLLVLTFLSPASAHAQTFSERWVYLSTNFLVDKNVDEAVALLDRAHKAGYTHVLVADSKFGRLPDMKPRYFDNCRRFRDAAQRVGIKLIPTVFPIGYSESILSQDVNLAEGVPVRAAPFIGKDGRASQLPDPETKLINADFEDVDGNKLLGWTFQDFIGQSTFADHAVVHSGKTSLRMENIGAVDPKHGHCRIYQPVKTHPFRQYHVSMWIKSQGFEAPANVRLAVLTRTGASLSYYDLSVKPTQDWTQHHLAFNSLDNDEVLIYCGVWNGRAGKLWWDDVRIEEPGLVNVLRRPGCPVKVTSADSDIQYVEGRDFQPIADPKLGMTPWPGCYEPFHTPPDIVLTPRSRIRDGQKLLVSYYHPIIVGDSQVTVALSEPGTYELLDDQMKRMHELWNADAYFMSFDEIRVGNWSEDSTARNLTPGQILADATRKCTAIARKHAPRATLYTWSDMFDPNHNAHDNYYLVHGNLAGSWEGLDKSVVVVNWNHEKRDASLKFFADRGHRQVIAGYYDDPVQRVQEWIASARTVKNVFGMMYTTWQHNYTDLEPFARLIK